MVLTPRPGESLTPTARLGIRALRSERPWQPRGSNSNPQQGRNSYPLRRPHASRPIPESRFIVVGGRMLAVAALFVGLVTAGSVALR